MNISHDKIRVQCCNCKHHFETNEMNWRFYNDGGSHKCPNCNTELVANYEYKLLSILDRLSLFFFVVAVVFLAADYSLGYSNSILTSLYWVLFLLSAISAIWYRLIISFIKTNPLATVPKKQNG